MQSSVRDQLEKSLKRPGNGEFLQLPYIGSMMFGSANATKSMNNPRYQLFKLEVFIPPLVTFKVLKSYSSHKSGPLGLCWMLVEGVKSYYEAR